MWRVYFEGRLLTRFEVQAIIERYDLQSQADCIWQMLQSELAITQSPLCCTRCHNQDVDQFEVIEDAEGIKRHYCLACLQLGRVIEGELLYSLPMPCVTEVDAELQLSWEGALSGEQQRVSNELLQGRDKGLPHLVWAVTGAGKTEMIYEVVRSYLCRGQYVVIASPRIDVCLELAPRFAQAFASVSQQVLYGEAPAPYQQVPLTIATTHQLLRFKEAFDLVVVDEVDAFPYVNSERLHFAVKRAARSKGHFIYLTATPDQALRHAWQKGALQLSVLPARYHGYPLPEPCCYWVGEWRQTIQNATCRGRMWRYVRHFVQLEGVKLIFVPDIQLAEQLAQQLMQQFPELSVASVHAQDAQRAQKVQQLREGQLTVLCSTTILERGVTFGHCQVCVVGAESRLFTEAALVQMSGRVGRKQQYPTGAVWWLHNGVSRAMKRAKRQIQQMNQQARIKGLLQHGG